MTELALTFDNGPDPAATPAVLDVLKDFGIRATFFLIGAKLQGPDGRKLAQRTRDEGHWLGNHTMSHSLTFGQIRDPAGARFEILETERLLAGLGHPDRLFRPYGGGGVIDGRLLSEVAVACLEEAGMTAVTWNSVPGDWKDPEAWVATALEDCAAAASPRVMVLHDVAGAAAECLPRFLERAARQGVVFVQSFPDEVVLIRRGVAQRDLSPFMAGG